MLKLELNLLWAAKKGKLRYCELDDHENQFYKWHRPLFNGEYIIMLNEIIYIYKIFKRYNFNHIALYYWDIGKQRDINNFFLILKGPIIGAINPPNLKNVGTFI